MPSEDLYEINMEIEVKIAKWRIDDQNNPENSEWALYVYDRLQRKWIDTAQCNRPGEEVHILKLEQK